MKTRGIAITIIAVAAVLFLARLSLPILRASPEARAVWMTRCTEDVTEEAAASVHQRAFWSSVVEGRATTRDVDLILGANFCGAPEKSICFHFARAVESSGGTIVSRLNQLQPSGVTSVLERCSGEFSADEENEITRLSR